MAASGSGDKSELLDLSKLSIEQLEQLKQEFEQEIANIQESLQTLYNCKGKYATSKEALESFQPKSEKSEILVPLTSSMYVPGRIKDFDSFILDIGTGYYIEKNLEDSKDYFKRRVDYVQEQIEKIERIQMQKTIFRDAVVNHLEVKVMVRNEEIKLKQAKQQTA